MQELSQADKEEVGRVPRTLEVELTRDLVDSCSAGDVVTALGIIKVLSTDAEAGKLAQVCLYERRPSHHRYVTWPLL